MFSELSEYYERRGIGKNFVCIHGPECRALCEDFVGPRAAFVGSKYESGSSGFPRMLFVSLDMAKDESDDDPDNRTLEFIRQTIELSPAPTRRNKHWYATYEFAQSVLNAIAEKTARKPVEFRDVREYFAHTNSAKCKDNAAGTSQGHRKLFENCCENVEGEVELLKPDIIVTQGVRAEEMALKWRFQTLEKLRHPNLPDRYWIYRLLVAGKKAIRIPTYHPNARRGLYQREMREAFQWYVRSICESVLA